MSVILETSQGDIVIDLLVDQAPKCCEKYDPTFRPVEQELHTIYPKSCVFYFLKLCKIKYYNFSPLHSVQPNFSFQTGDPLGPDAPTSDGGSSIWGILNGSSSKTFVPEFHPKLKHDERGTVSMATAPSAKDSEERLAGSQFIVTLGDNLDYLDGKAAVFGKVAEGYDVLEKINAAFVDEKGRPLKDIRVRHTVILEDPFPDPSGLIEPPESPVPTKAQLATVRIADDEDIAEDTDPEALEKLRRERDARAQALTLEMVGDLPFAEVKPPENVLFVCKLNPVTRDEDLELIFSRFGKILSCEVIRDKQSGDSLQYAFIEFEEQKDCEMAYFKMQNVLIDDHRIHVDFSQSVSKLSADWRNATNSKRRKQGGGWGGIEGLEKRRQYRIEEDRGDDGYSMVVERNGNGSRDDKKDYEKRDRDNKRHRSRSKSPRRRDDRYKRRSPDRRRRSRDRDGRRERSRERYRDDRRRDRSRDRDRERHRDVNHGYDRRR